MGTRNDIRVLERRIVQVAREIRALEGEMDRAAPRARAAYAKDLTELERRRAAIQERLAGLRLDQALAWEKNDFATGLERVIARLTRRMGPLPPRR